jgi:hypothetical protein
MTLETAGLNGKSLWFSKAARGKNMKRTLWISVATMLSASVIALAAHSIYGERARADDQDSAGGWEYLVVQGGTVNLSGGDGGSMRKADGAFSRESYPLERNMDKLGAKGWELVTVTGEPRDPIYYFKRRK